MARRAVVDQRCDLPPLAVGIREIRRRRSAGAAGRYRHRPLARLLRPADRLAGAPPPGNRAGELIFSLAPLFAGRGSGCGALTAKPMDVIRGDSLSPGFALWRESDLSSRRATKSGAR